MTRWRWRACLGALLAAGCTVTAPSGRFVCSDDSPSCPPGQRCVDGLCISGEGGPDAGARDASADADRPDSALAEDAAFPPDAESDAGGDAGGAPATCPTLDPPPNGSVDGAAGSAGDVATYRCDTGYVLTGNGGSDTRTCQSDGSWSGLTPTCEVAVSPCEPSPCLNGGLCTRNDDSFSCTCAMGFQGPTCAARVTCPTLVTPENGSVDRTTGSFGDVATYACDSGYLPSSVTMRTCQADGTWSGVAPTCVRGGCAPILVAPAHGSVDRTTGMAGDVATYSCDVGYALVGDSTRTCGDDGSWSGTAPTCAGVPCAGTLSAPANGAVDRTTGSTGDVATYTCDRGYLVEGAHSCVPATGACDVRTTSTRTCQADGTWSGAVPRCIGGIWAVGGGGTIIRYNGVRWIRVPSGTDAGLLGVWGTSPTDAWAVGFDGTIVHWDGMRWGAVPSGTTERLMSVGGSSDRDAWAVGFGGTIRRWDGVAWSAVGGATGWLQDVWAASSSDAWIIGYDGLFRWQGTAWTPASPVPFAISSGSGLGGSSSTHVVAVGNGSAAYRWDGASWTAMPLPFSVQLEAVWTRSATDVWAVGVVSGPRGVILRWDGTTWTSIPHPVTSLSLCDWFRGVWGTSPNDVWIVGQCSLVHWDGTSITHADASLLPLGAAPTLNAVWGPR